MSLCSPLFVQGQYLRSSYYMDGSSTRLALNPAMYPQRGFINLPVIGGINFDLRTNALGFKDVQNMIDDDFSSTDEIISRLNAQNNAEFSMGSEVISFGFHARDNFFTFGIASHVDIDAQIPKSMFEYINSINNDTFSGTRHYDIADQNLNVNAYTEIGVGFSRNINDRLTIGAKAKMLLGNANMSLKVNQLKIDAYMPEESYSKAYLDAVTDVEFALSGEGVIIEEDGDGNIEKISVGDYGIGGYGAALDLGVNYALTDRLSLSAAVTDLGFISWSKESTVIYTSKEQVHVDDIDEVDILDFDTFGLKNGVNEGRSTSLRPTVSVGAEYSFAENKLGVGLLSTTRFGGSGTFTELTALATYRPGTMFNATLSYSMVHGYDTFGLALKLGPLMLGTDYMVLSGNTQRTNIYMGLSIPLAKKK